MPERSNRNREPIENDSSTVDRKGRAMSGIGDEILLQRLTAREDSLSEEFDGIESQASYLLGLIAILAGLPAVISDKSLTYWGHFARLGSLVLIFAILMAVLAAGGVLWVFLSQDYAVEDSAELISWRDEYVSENPDADPEDLTAEIRNTIISGIAQRIKHNEVAISEKAFRLQATYYATTISGIANLVLLIPMATHRL